VRTDVSFRDCVGIASWLYASLLDHAAAPRMPSPNELERRRGVQAWWKRLIAPPSAPRCNGTGMLDGVPH